MDEEEYEYEDEGNEEVVTIPPIKARPIDYLVAVLIFLSDVAEKFGEFMNMIVSITARHANYRNEQERFASAIRSDLENIPTKEET